MWNCNVRGPCCQSWDLCSGSWHISELPLADIFLHHDPMIPGVKLGSHLLPNILAFMKEVSDVLTQRHLGCMLARGILYAGCGNHFPSLFPSSMEGLGSAARPAELNLKLCRNPSKSFKAMLKWATLEDHYIEGVTAGKYHGSSQ